VREEKTGDTEDVATSAAVNHVSTASADTDDAPTRVKNDNSNDRTLDQKDDGSNDSGDNVGLP
jgi:hypothetical protein